jgi:hypothetical protein
VGKLGVRLTPEHVAADVWRVVHERPRPFASPHRAVGRQARLLATLSGISPDWAQRLVVRRLAG